MGARVRLATLAKLRSEMFPLYLDPVPKQRTLMAWMRAARIPHMKTNPRARNGGGQIYWNVVAVETWLRKRAGLPS